MFKLNLKIALRNLWKNKISSFINVIGLAIGLAACLMLLIYVSYEWNFDKQAGNAGNIYKMMTNLREDNGKVFMTFDGTTTALGPLVKQEIPEVKYISRMNYGKTELIANGNNSFKRYAKFAEPDILKMYDYHFIAGDPKTALSSPNAVILTESTAKVLFGTADVLNRSVRFRDQSDLMVTGVVRDLSENSSNKFDYLMPWSFYTSVDEEARDINWNNYSYITLVSLNPDANIDAVNKKIDALVRRNNKSKFQPFFLFPLSKLHLFGKFENGKSTGGAIEQIWLFMGLAFGILLIACINFMNMATAKSERRAKEVGIKKTIGATRGSLIIQFLTESMVLTLVGVLLAVTLVEMTMPAFNHLLNINLSLNYFNTYSWFGVLGIVLLTGFIAGSYPAFYLSSFSPVQTMKRKIKGRKGFSVSLRQVLIIGQFSFTIVLIISTMVIYKQIQYIKNKPVGADVNTLVEMAQDGNLGVKFDLLKSQLLKSGAVSGVYQSATTLVHHDSNFSGLEWPGMTSAENSQLFNRMITSYDFIKTSGLKLLQGRDFSEKYASDSASVLVSASAVKVMGMKNPIGQLIKHNERRSLIIGVFEDYTWDSPYQANHPMIVYLGKKEYGSVTMRLNTANSAHDNIETIERITKAINPAYPVEVKFTNAAYEELFNREKTLGILSNLFGGLAIFISCLGLFGLAAYSAEQRTKEFGVRKVLGASVYSLMQLLSLSFLKMILISVIIAVPAAYYVMGIWLDKFEFHTGISWWIAVAAASGTLMIALFTVSYQAYKTATANPVDALKYE
jgi:putative ABC transport system permease protein